MWTRKPRGSKISRIAPVELLATAVVLVLSASSLGAAAIAQSGEGTVGSHAGVPTAEGQALSTAAPAVPPPVASHIATYGDHGAGHLLPDSDPPGPGVEIANFTVGTSPSQVVYDPANGLLYVANTGSDNVSVINGTTNRVVLSVPVGIQPETPCVDTSTDQVFVPNYANANVSVISGATNTVVANVPVGSNPRSCADGSTNDLVYIDNYGSENLSVIDAPGDNVIANIALGGNPSTPAFDSSNDTMFVYANDAVHVISCLTNTVVAGITRSGQLLNSAVTPTYDPANGEVYIASDFSSGSDPITVVNGTTYAIVATVWAGGYASTPAYDPINGDLYVSNYYTDTGDNVTVVSGASNTVVANVPVGSNPIEAGVDTVNGNVFVPNPSDSNISIISGATNKLLANVNTTYGSTYPFQPGTPTFDPSNYEFFVSGGTQTVAVFSTPPPPVYPVTFSESGLPSGLPWQVSLGGAPMSLTTDGGTDSLTFTVANGSYRYSVSEVPGWTQSTLSPTGSVVVVGAPVTEPTLVYSPVQYSSSVAISLDPSTITLWQSSTVSVTVTGGGPTPTGSVSVSDGLTGSGDTCTIPALDTSGSGSCVLTPSQAGQLIVTATYGGDSSHEPGAATAALVVAGPSILLSPGVAPVGALVNVSGSGFTPGEVTVTFGSSPTTLGTPSANSTGFFQLPFAVPPFSPGNYTVTATDSRRASASAKFRIALPLSEISGTTQQITTNPAGSFNPAISGDIVTYTSFQTGPANVFYTDLSDGMQTQVTDVAVGQDIISDVSGNTIVYVNETGVVAEVQGYVIGGTNNPFDIAPNPDVGQTTPSIDGSIVAWEQTDPTYTFFQVFARDLSTGTTKDLTPGASATESAYIPRVSGDLVAYCEQSSSGGSQLMVTNFLTLASTAIATGCNQLLGLDISGNYVVDAYLDAATEQDNLGLYDLSTGTVTTLSPTPGSHYQDPHISGDWVSFDAWETSTAGSYSSVMLYNIPTGEYFVVAPGTSPENSAFMNAINVSDGIGRVAYTDNSPSGLVDQVYVFQFNALSPPTISVAPATVEIGQPATLSIVAPPSSGAPPYTCEWLYEPPGASGFTELAPSDCSDGASQICYVPGLWSFELQVTDSIGLWVVSNAVTLTVVQAAATSTIAVPGYPFGIAVDPATNTVYTSNEADNVSVISGVTDRVLDGIAVGDDPQGIAVDPNTDTIYVVNYESSNVSVINGVTDRVSATIPIGENVSGPEGIAVDPATDMVYVGVVNGLFGGNVVVIDGATDTVVATIPTPGYGQGLAAVSLAVNPVTDTIYVQDGGITDEGCTPTGSSCSPLYVISGATDTVTATVSLPPDDSGNYPFKVAFDPTNDTVYVANPATSATYVVSGTSNELTATVPDGTSPVGVAVDPSTNMVFVSDLADNLVYMISGSSNEVSATIPVGDAPAGIAVDPVTNCVYVANTGDSTVSVIAPSGDLASCSASPPKVAYAVRLTESGLPAGTAWYVNVTGGLSYSSTSNTIGFSAQNGTYPYTVATTDKRYAAAPGSFVVAGTAISVDVNFTLQLYTLTLKETGIPAKALAKDGWTVVVAGDTLHDLLSEASFTLPNGTYALLVTGPAGYVLLGGPAPPVTVSGPTSETLVFDKGRTVTLTFTEKGLPKGQSWCVEVEKAQQCSTTSSLKYLNLTPGTYGYAMVSPLGGQNVTQKVGTTVTYGSTGSIDLTGSATVALTFAYRYAVTFTETGAPTGTWSVTVNGVTRSNATGDPISFDLTNGTYGYMVGAETGYTASGYPARVTVHGGPVSVVVRFKAKTGSDPGSLRDLVGIASTLPSILGVAVTRRPRGSASR